MKINFNEIRQQLYVAVVCDALDSIGFRYQSPVLPFIDCTGMETMVGRAKTTLWVDMFHKDPSPYTMELQAVDSCQPDDIIIAAAGGSLRSGIWGELLSTAAQNSGCNGALIHGGVRDVNKMRQMEFPVFATAKIPYDSQHRQRVVDVDVEVAIGGVSICPGDIVFADADGVVVIPHHVEEEVLQLAMKKVNDENISRDAIKQGMKASAAYEKYGVL
ncbi:RraA family protein [Membranihabitans marinus]|uniref:RraA family protein n=1 Tax=Membranihabitans marinus TaxID=1227546 RepID=UPI001F2B9461|nr:hypothetical protein [Membranihabitans marinus]